MSRVLWRLALLSFALSSFGGWKEPLVALAVRESTSLRSTLPMAGKPDDCYHLRAFPDRSGWMVFPYCRGPERLTVWRQQGDWFRITPDGFPYQGWVEVDEVDLDATQEVDVHPPYLEMIE